MWLALFKANTEEELKMIEEQGVTEISEVVTAYRKVSKSREFREMERLMEKAEIDEASKLAKATRKGREEARKEYDAELTAKDNELTAKDNELTAKDALIKELQAKLAEHEKQAKPETAL